MKRAHGAGAGADAGAAAAPRRQRRKQAHASLAPAPAPALVPAPAPAAPEPAPAPHLLHDLATVILSAAAERMAEGAAEALAPPRAVAPRGFQRVIAAARGGVGAVARLAGARASRRGMEAAARLRSRLSPE